MGSEPVASKLLFAPPAPSTDDGTEWHPDAFEMEEEGSGREHRGLHEGKPKTDQVIQVVSKA